MYSSKIFDQNPWWEDIRSIERDPHIRAWTESGLGWSPKTQFEDRDYVYSLRGTRQVGKTTTIKLDIQQRLKARPGNAILYYAFDLENSPREIVDIIEQYLNWSQRLGERRYLYLDEVTNVRSWQKAIKYLRDRGRLVNCTVVVVGSNSVDLRKGTELLPGRRGISSEPLDRIQEPLKFGDYVTAMNRDLGSSIKKYKDHGISAILQMAEGDIPDDVYALTALLSKLNFYLDEYFVVGGMPIAVTAFKRLGVIPDSVYKTYLDAVTNDLKSVGSNMAYVEQIMPNIIKSVCSPVSWRSLSRDTDIGSHHTVLEYVMTLADAFVLNIVYRYNMSSDGPKYNGMKKIYFRDPLFLHAWNTARRQESIFRASLAYAEETNIKPRIAEQTAAGHITRLAFNISRNKIMHNDQLSVFYWSSKNNNEVDFAVRNGSDIIPIEVKYKNRIRTEDVYGMIDMRKAGGTSGGLVLTCDEIGCKGGNVLVPLAVFLALI